MALTIDDLGIVVGAAVSAYRLARAALQSSGLTREEADEALRECVAAATEADSGTEAEQADRLRRLRERLAPS